MLRTILSVFGIAELLRPGALVAAAERLALENPDECELRPWTVPAVRAEGAVFLLLVRPRGRAYSTFRKLLGVIGILALLYPRAYVDYATKLAYTDADACSWRPWVYQATRLVGLYYVLVSVLELRRGSRSEEQASESN